MEDGSLLRGVRVVIPVKHQETVLAELHLNHLGIVGMKALVRLHVWWSTLDTDTEKLVGNCEVCQITLIRYGHTNPGNECTFIIVVRFLVNLS